jgi:tetratricopeptide (TPR) repeat protein
LAAALDDDPGSMRQELRAILARGRLPVERALAMLSAALRPVPVPVEVPLGADRARLRQLAERIDPAKEPVLGLLTLTRALRVAGEEALAERLLRKALTARPQEVVLYHTLGDFLRGEQPPRWREAVEFYKVARGLRPDLGVTLAGALRRIGREGEALDLLAVLVKETPDNPYLYFQQAYALHEKGDVDGAITCYKKTLELDPKHAPAHNNLGNDLYDKHDWDDVIACYKKALELDPKFTQAHYSLGLGLRTKGDLDGAIACYKKALELDPKDAEAHCYLGHILREQGLFTEAVASLRRGHELGSKQPGWHNPSAQWLRDTELLAALAGKLPAILTGGASPANPGEAVTLAQMCQLPYQKRFVASARFYADGFAANPNLAADLNQQHRYNAACSAALAAAGQGEDARLLPDKVTAMLRRWTLGWLRDDLTNYAKLAEQNKPAVNQTIQQRLAHWRRDADLASVRDPSALDHLGDNERDAWQALWRDVDELAKRVANK